VEGGIWPTPKFWCGAPYDLPHDVKSSQVVI